MRIAHLAPRLASWFPFVAACLPAQEAQHEALVTWFATASSARSELPGGERDLDRAAAAKLRDELWRALQEARRRAGDDDLVAAAALPKEAAVGELRVGEFVMPYVLLQRGEKPAKGWPLWICLHGGGGNDAAEGPHAWDVNTREWNAQKRLYERVYRGDGLWFVPRMADDRKGRWWFAHNQIAFARVIERAILFREVDPDRVHLIGISEGGYGAIRFAGNRPDRFASCGGMAAAEPLSTSPPENMRNVALRIDIGEKDTMFDRIGLARRMGERLGELRAEDPQGYDFVLNVQEGRGHGIDYALTPPWAATKVRDARPSRVVWHVVPFDGEVELRHHWLAFAERPVRLPLVVSATLAGQTLSITSEFGPDTAASEGEKAAPGEATLLVRLDDELVDLDQPIELVVDGVAQGAVRVPRSASVLARTLEERCDPRTAFCGELRIPLSRR